MIKQRSSDLRPRSPLGIFGLLRQSFKTIKSNRKLLLPVLVQIYLIQPVFEDLILKQAERWQLFLVLDINMRSTGYRDPVSMAISEVFLLNVFIIKFCSITSILFWNATASSSSEASTPKVIDLKEMILKTSESSKKLAVICFYMILVISGLIFVGRYSGITSVSVECSWPCACLSFVVLLSITVYEFYLSALGVTSLVVSVVEDVGGVKAIVRARKLMKGKELQASLLMVFFALAYGLVHSTTNGIASHNHGKWSRLAISIRLIVGLLSALKLFVFVVFIVFYFERKESCDEKEAKSLTVPIVLVEV